MVAPVIQQLLRWFSRGCATCATVVVTHSELGLAWSRGVAPARLDLAGEVSLTMAWRKPPPS